MAQGISYELSASDTGPMEDTPAPFGMISIRSPRGLLSTGTIAAETLDADEPCDVLPIIREIDSRAARGVRVLLVEIDSRGGQLIAGHMLYDALRRFSEAGGTVVTYGEHYIASTACEVLLAGDFVMLHPDACVMVHGALDKAGAVLGKNDEMAAIDNMEMAAIYGARTSTPFTELASWLWLESGGDRGLGCHPFKARQALAMHWCDDLGAAEDARVLAGLISTGLPPPPTPRSVLLKSRRLPEDVAATVRFARLRAARFRDQFEDGQPVVPRRSLFAMLGIANAQAAQQTADDAQTAADNAASSAATANAALADIASDSKLTPAEKRAVLTNAHDLVDNQSAIDSQASAFGITTEKTAYDTAISALSTYLGTLSLTLGTNDATWQTTTTTIDGPTFRSKFSTAYSTRQTLLNAISAKAKALADAAQGTANSASSAAAAAQSTADSAATAASNASTLAGSKTVVTYAATPPSSPSTGDIWFSTDTTTNCPVSACKGHTLDAAGAIRTGTYPHRKLYWAHRWSGSAWVDGQGVDQICAADVVGGQALFDALTAGLLKTSNYAEDGSGNPTVGAKLDSQGTALKVAPGNLQVGAKVLSDLWFAGLKVVGGSLYWTGAVWTVSNGSGIEGPTFPNSTTARIFFTNPDGTNVWLAPLLTLYKWSGSLGGTPVVVDVSQTGGAHVDFQILNSSGTAQTLNSTTPWRVQIMMLAAPVGGGVFL